MADLFERRESPMAMCWVCRLDMSSSKTGSCSAKRRSKLVPISKDGVIYDPVPYNAGKDVTERDGGPCHDCNVLDGGIHHFGCDMELCPVCGGQFISCGCFDECYEHLTEDEGE